MQVPPNASKTRINLELPPQPTDTSCGPTCLHALYKFYGENIGIEQLIEEIEPVEGGGTLAVMLGIHALRRGYRAILYTFNIRIFDPTWFNPKVPDFEERLAAQLQIRTGKKIRQAANAYLEFHKLGGDIRFDVLNGQLIRRFLKRERPILTGLSSTFLYGDAREIGETNKPDDLRGDPVGHFVLLCGYDRETMEVEVADPHDANPLSENRHYNVGMENLLNAILLGVLTYDGNLLILEPPAK